MNRSIPIPKMERGEPLTRPNEHQQANRTTYTRIEQALIVLSAVLIVAAIIGGIQ